MEYIYIGKLVNTHGIKGEVRIISYFTYKDKVFKNNKEIFIGEEHKKETINTYRVHKQYDMITFNGINDILDVLIYKGKNVYVDKEKLELDDNEILDEDLINIEAYFNNKKIGEVKEIINNNGYKIISVNKILIPYNSNFINKIVLNENKIIFKNVEEFIK